MEGFKVARGEAKANAVPRAGTLLPQLARVVDTQLGAQPTGPLFVLVGQLLRGGQVTKEIDQLVKRLEPQYPAAHQKQGPKRNK